MVTAVLFLGMMIDERQGVDLLELGSIFLDLLAEIIQLLVYKARR